MASELVIVESPAKARTIHRILGSGFEVKASMGHVRDLPPRKLGVDVRKGFRPEYVTIKGREKTVRDLVAAARRAHTVYLAPDPDREGEAIAWHLMELLGDVVPPDRFRRVVYHEITPAAIRRAFGEPGRLDLRKVHSQQARRILDRLVGYRVSPLLWRRIRGASSAGRVQSVALRLVCEREREIEAFVPKEYWVIGARVGKQVEPRDPFVARLARIDGEKAEIGSAAEAGAVRADLEGRALRVASVATRETAKKPFPPFITSTLQQAGARLCGFSPSRTMRVAQSLYEGVDLGDGPAGLITYMRTDSVHVSAEAIGACRAFVAETYGPDYAPAEPNRFRSRSGAQEAHEAIRPTDVRRAPDAIRDRLKPDEFKLYRAIWQRFVASQMAPARIAQRLVEIEATPPGPGARAYRFRASASEVVFPGYLKAMEAEPRAVESSAEPGEPESQSLPPLVEGEPLDLHEWLTEQKFTSPPARYSEATLVKALEEHGIGRPSTYAQTLSTLVDRRYVTREKRQLAPSPLGMATHDFLVSRLDELFNVKFTADMEARLDRVEGGEEDWTEMLRSFHDQFGRWLEGARAPDSSPEEIRRLLDALGRVAAWEPPAGTGRGRRDDRAFFESVRTQAARGEPPLTDRQVAALKRLAARYAGQVPELADFPPGDGEDSGPGSAPREVSESARAKLALLRGVAFDAPRRVGKRSFDDAKFHASLAGQVEAGRGLSPAQEQALNRMIRKYRDRIPDFESRAGGLDLEDAEPDDTPAAAAQREEIARLLAGLETVRSWKPPAERKGRVWDDQAFFQSLREQFRQKNRLSPRQVSALRRLACGYAPDKQPAPENAGP